MKRIPALIAGFLLRFAGLWLGCLAGWLVRKGSMIEASVNDYEWPGSA